MASADTLSPVYPDRPIRPLPKNRLKSRLSPEQSASLIYPPDPPISSLSFNFPFGGSEKTADGRSVVNGHAAAAAAAAASAAAHYDDQLTTHCTCGGDHGEDSSEEEIIYDHPNFRVQSPVEGAQQRRLLGEQRVAEQQNRRAVGGGEEQQKLVDESRAGGRGGGQQQQQKPASIASSTDCYESFENTSNKKKRKIPGVHQSSLTAELANMGISSSHANDGIPDDVLSPNSQNNNSTSYAAATGMGHSGAGRGRASKTSPMRRRERGSISHITPSSTHHAVEQSVERGGAYKDDGTRINPEHRIISNAIANAQSQPSTPQKGRENVSLLSQHSPKSGTPKTQFTFTCESDSSNKMMWPGQGGQPPYSNVATPSPGSTHQQHYPSSTATTATSQLPPSSSVSQSTQATQTIPAHMRRSSTSGAPLAPHQQNNLQSAQATPGAAAPPKKTRPRRPSREYALAARQRRLQQEYNNFHHKPTKENMWICEFCEYEDIWGTPPLALIRQYEIKDRAERKKQEEKRRLLEKAKMKGRKGKKGTKGGKGSGNTTAQQQQSNHGAAAGGPQQQAGGGAQQHYDQNGDPVAHSHHSQDDGHEEYYDDEYDDGGYDPVEPNDRGGGGGGGPPLSPQACHQSPTAAAAAPREQYLHQYSDHGDSEIHDTPQADRHSLSAA